MPIASCLHFRSLLKSSCIPLIGAYNGLVARAIASHGFKALYVSGGALCASTGQPDIGLVTLNGFCEKIKEVHMSSGLPVLADADTGFGEGEMTAKTVWEYFTAGAAGLHIEDQVFPKRCGHLDGKSLVPIEVMTKKIAIASEASKQCSQGSFIICARTDAFSTSGLQETINRSKEYIYAGADMIFPEGLNTRKDFEEVAKALKEFKKEKRGGDLFLLANMTEFGKTEYIKLDEFEKMGYNCVLYPVTTLRVAMKAVDDFLISFKENRTQENYLNKMQSRKELYELLQYKPENEWYYPSSTVRFWDETNGKNKK